MTECKDRSAEYIKELRDEVKVLAKKVESYAGLIFVNNVNAVNRLKTLEEWTEAHEKEGLEYGNILEKEDKELHDEVKVLTKMVNGMDKTYDKCIEDLYEKVDTVEDWQDARSPKPDHEARAFEVECSHCKGHGKIIMHDSN